jgi:uncharacterized protein (DUF58 family)
VEFADFRDYAPGDDFRRVDWNAYARLDRLFLRLYQAEQMTTLTLFLDHSPSMSFGQPAKAVGAGRLAAIFAFIALHTYDRVVVVGWGETVDHRLHVRTGKRAIPEVWRFISEVMSAPAGPTDFGALRDYAACHRGRGLAVVLSDFLTDTDWRSGLQALRGAGQEVSAVQVLSPDELDPELRGDWTLHDTETGSEVEVTVSPRLLRRYREELEAHTDAVRGFCRRQNIAFLQLASDVSLQEHVLTTLRHAGVLQ